MKRINEIDVVRVISTLGIVIFHFSLANESCRFLVEYGAGDWGTVFVNVFFMVSGFCLYCNNQKISKVYFWKRIKSIFPMFYVAFGFMFIRYVCANGNLFYLGVKKPLILTVFGLDGYFLYKGVNYYILGEWFLGALVLIYLLYPLLLFCMEKSEILSSIIVFALYGFMLWGYSLPEPLFEIRESRNLISCILCFWLGMLLYRHAERLLYHRLLPIVGLLIFLGAYFIPHVNILNHVAALGMFLFLFGIGSILDRSSHLTKGFAWMASLSYPIFLVHHVLINDMASIIVKINTWSRYCIVLIFLFVITFLEGWALLQIGNAINQLPLMKSLEHRMKGSAH